MKNKPIHSCSCYRARHSRWIEPSILYLLCKRPRHGYELMGELPELGFVENSVDAGAVYRMLRHLEENGFVRSQWDTSGSGPAKRLYTITTAGRDHLGIWADLLQRRAQALQLFVGELDALLNPAVAAKNAE